MPNQNFTDPKDFLNQTVTVTIDRPLNSKHDKFDMIYEVNYGFIPNTVAPDGEELDAYILGVKKPLEQFTGKCIAIIHRINDDDDKLIVVPEKLEISDEEIQKQTNFQEKWFKSIIIRK
ncbi:MAG TPA: inorganic diphosphatase [bacterium]|nr:inorganic diphosphatase [bacterium]HPL95396.1 inorganic diphosphatase [bacterium]